MVIKILASGSKGNCCWISDGKTSLLLEAGIPIRDIQRNFKLTGLGGCLITHEHGDHAKAGADLMKRSVDIYTSQGTATARSWKSYRLHTVKSGCYFEVGTFKVMPFELEHDAAEPLGFFIISQETQERLLYITDTHYARYRFNNLTHIMCECNYDKEILLNNVKNGVIDPFLAQRIMRNHMSIETVIEMLQANNLTLLQQIYLLHLSEANSDAEVFKKRIQRLTGAEVYVCY